jgi:hypothetical protein
MQWIKQNVNIRGLALTALALAAGLCFLMVVGHVNKAKAADPPQKPSAIKAQPIKPAAPAPVKMAEAPKSTWTGVHVSGFGTHIMSELDFGGPVGLSANGQMVGGCAGASVQTGQLVFGGEACYGWVFGDLKDVGLQRETEIEITGTGGVALGLAKLYGHVSWSEIRTGAGDFTGWKYGPGIEVKMPDAPGWSVDLRGGFANYDIASGVEADSVFLRGALVKRFDMPANWFGN